MSNFFPIGGCARCCERWPTGWRRSASARRCASCGFFSREWCSEGESAASIKRVDWYSEALFARDDRFEFKEALQAVDPANCSHPVWDAALDARAPEVREGWVLRAPVPAPHPTLDWEDFAALKRRFYFEHEKGEEVFDLEDPDAKEFADLVQGSMGSGRTLVSNLVDAINAAYCPLRFDSRDQHLYLWSGHRFHEQPSRSFVAADRVATDDLVTEVPRLPAGLEECFDYRPDHIALTAYGVSGTPRLRIDFPLWRTLCRLARGLPRKLIPERDIHRLDAFLQKIGAKHGRAGATPSGRFTSKTWN